MMLFTNLKLAERILLDTETYKGTILVYYDEGSFALFFNQEELTNLNLQEEGTKLLTGDGVTPEGLDFLSKAKV